MRSSLIQLETPLFGVFFFHRWPLCFPQYNMIVLTQFLSQLTYRILVIFNLIQSLLNTFFLLCYNFSVNMGFGLYHSCYLLLKKRVTDAIWLYLPKVIALSLFGVILPKMWLGPVEYWVWPCPWSMNPQLSRCFLAADLLRNTAELMACSWLTPLRLRSCRWKRWSGR